jgi:hypothetical protein
MMARKKLTEEEMEIVLGYLLKNTATECLIDMTEQLNVSYLYYWEDCTKTPKGKVFIETEEEPKQE